MNDLSEDTDLLKKEEPTDEQLSREFVRPAYSFKGETLRPYTAGTSLLFSQVLDRNDAAQIAVLAFIFIHRTSIPREKLLELCWDKIKFRAALLDWMDSLGPFTQADQNEADDIFVEMRRSAEQSVVEPKPDASSPQKKTKGSRQRK
jgi:hypothetical protein